MVQGRFLKHVLSVLSGSQKWATFSRNNIEVYSLCEYLPFPTKEIRGVASLQRQMSRWYSHHIRIPGREI